MLGGFFVSDSPRKESDPPCKHVGATAFARPPLQFHRTEMPKVEHLPFPWNVVAEFVARVAAYLAFYFLTKKPPRKRARKTRRGKH